MITRYNSYRTSCAAIIYSENILKTNLDFFKRKAQSQFSLWSYHNVCFHTYKEGVPILELLQVPKTRKSVKWIICDSVPVLVHSRWELYPASMSNKQNHRFHLWPRLDTETHRCWGASGDGRYEPLSPASDGLWREKSQFRQVTEQPSVYTSSPGQIIVFSSWLDFYLCYLTKGNIAQPSET